MDLHEPPSAHRAATHTRGWLPSAVPFRVCLTREDRIPPLTRVCMGCALLPDPFAEDILESWHGSVCRQDNSRRRREVGLGSCWP